MVIGVPIIWTKKFISKWKDQRIPKHNINSITDGNLSTVPELYDSARINLSLVSINAVNTPRHSISFNNNKHNKNLVTLTMILASIILFFLVIFFVFSSRLG